MPKNFMSIPFSDFAELCEELTSTSKKLEKISLLSQFLKSLNERELESVPLFIIGRAFPLGDFRTLNVSWRTIQRLSENISPKAKPSSLTILEVCEFFSRIALISGKGSRKQIDSVLIDLFSHTSKIERKYLIRIIFGEMRIGVAEGVLLEGIAKAANADLEDVRQAQMFLGDPGMVAKIALRNGISRLKRVNLQLFKPLQPMLAALAEDFSVVFKEHGEQSAFEIKFDGARVQIHKQKNKVKIYSRHLSDVTSSLPDLVEVVRKGIKADRIIIEGEVVAIGKNDRPLPFQELMRRFHRVHDIEQLIDEDQIRIVVFFEPLKSFFYGSDFGNYFNSRIILMDHLSYLFYRGFFVFNN
jgi:DNA ligase-1